MNELRRALYIAATWVWGIGVGISSVVIGNAYASAGVVGRMGIDQLMLLGAIAVGLVGAPVWTLLIILIDNALIRRRVHLAFRMVIDALIAGAPALGVGMLCQGIFGLWGGLWQAIASGILLSGVISLASGAGIALLNHRAQALKAVGAFSN